MKGQVEDRLREVLADRSDDVVRPDGWETRVLQAGHRRLARRRIGTVVGAVAAVLAVLLAGGTVIPGALNGAQPAGPDQKNGVLDPGKLPVGGRTTSAIATVDDESLQGALVWAGRRSWGLGRDRPVDVAKVRGGVLVAEGDVDERLVYHPDRGEARTLQRDGGSAFAVSPDGAKVAWLAGIETRTLKLAALPSGRILAEQRLDPKGPLGQGMLRPFSFLDDRVVLAVDELSPPYAWDPGSRTLTPLLGKTASLERMGLLGVSRSRDTVLLEDKKQCVHNVSLSRPDQPARWTRCDFGRDLLTGLSPDGRSLAVHGADGSTVSVRDVSTGELRWKRKLEAGVDWGDSWDERRLVSGSRVSRIEWESAGQLLVMYGTSRDLDMETGDLLRCGERRPACERVPTTDGYPVTVLEHAFVQ